jgi:glycosyltransferase involved in cell wall biosynthesis
MKISIIIPCIPEHFFTMMRAADAYLKQTRIPDEIVIVLSNSSNLEQRNKILFKKFTDEIFLKTRKNNIRIYYVNNLLSPGAARTLCSQYCQGDLLILNDADDMPHRRRTEIIEGYFNSRDIIALNHSFWWAPNMRENTIAELNEKTEQILKNIKVIQSSQIYEHYQKMPDDVYGQFCDFNVGAGCGAYKKEVFRTINYIGGMQSEDRIFCLDTLRKYNKSIIINAPLYFYYK